MANATSQATSQATSVFDCEELSVRQINIELRALEPGSRVQIINPRGRHNLAVGLVEHLDITFAGSVGHYIGGLCDGVDIRVQGFCSPPATVPPCCGSCNG